jgi:2-dehydro-3-deoxyphosphooctonate aldolase (KDO 8-P synthase)
MNEFKPLEKTVELKSKFGNITWGDCKSFVLFAGPDIIEDDAMVIETAQEIKRVTTALGIPWILKCSFDKANRQSSKSFRGPGMKQALNSLEKIKVAVGQTDLMVAAAKTGRVIHIKKGQFLAPWDMKAIAQKAVQAGNDKLLLCERGTTFGYNRLVNDMTGLVEMRRLGFPVIMDCTHSTQLPGATGESSGGRGDMVWPLGRAAVAVGVDGIFLETHPNPEKALCDGPTSLPLRNLESVLKNLKNIFDTHQK